MFSPQGTHLATKFMLSIMGFIVRVKIMIDVLIGSGQLAVLLLH